MRKCKEIVAGLVAGAIIATAFYSFSALPNKLESARMTDSTPAKDIDNEVGDLEQAIADIFGVTIDTTISAPAMVISPVGMTTLIFQDSPSVTPATQGYLQRSGDRLLFYGSQVNTIGYLADVGQGLQSIVTFPTSSTWTRPTGITEVLVFVVGAGGGGGGSDSDGDPVAASAGGGGGAGSYAAALLDVTNIASSTITRGTGGAGGSVGGTNGSAGTNSSWADGTNTVTGIGGSGGTGGDSVGGAGVSGTGGSGGTTGTGGDFGGKGGDGEHGIYLRSDVGAAAGHGGASFVAAGGKGGHLTSAGESTGSDGESGSGGGGGATVDSTTGAAGGAGGNGIVIVYEYIK